MTIPYTGDWLLGDGGKYHDLQAKIGLPVYNQRFVGKEGITTGSHIKFL
jgi:hypothetical protein